MSQSALELHRRVVVFDKTERWGLMEWNADQAVVYIDRIKGVESCFGQLSSFNTYPEYLSWSHLG